MSRFYTYSVSNEKESEEKKEPVRLLTQKAALHKNRVLLLAKLSNFLSKYILNP